MPKRIRNSLVSNWKWNSFDCIAKLLKLSKLPHVRKITNMFPFSLSFFGSRTVFPLTHSHNLSTVFFLLVSFSSMNNNNTIIIKRLSYTHFLFNYVAWRKRRENIYIYYVPLLYIAWLSWIMWVFSVQWCNVFAFFQWIWMVQEWKRQITWSVSVISSLVFGKLPEKCHTKMSFQWMWCEHVVDIWQDQ